MGFITCNYPKCKQPAVRQFKGDDKPYCLYHHKVMTVDANIAQLQKDANVPKLYRNARLDDLDKSLLDAIPLTSSVLLTGDVSRGKTHIALALLRNDLYRGCQTPRFTSMVDLLRRIKATYDKNAIETENDIYEMFTKNENIYIDDIGVEKVTEWVLNVIYAIVDYRYSNELRTVFTSNLNMDQLADRLGIRIAARIADMCEVIEIMGVNRRRT